MAVPIEVQTHSDIDAKEKSDIKPEQKLEQMVETMHGLISQDDQPLTINSVSVIDNPAAIEEQNNHTLVINEGANAASESESESETSRHELNAGASPYPQDNPTSA